MGNVPNVQRRPLPVGMTTTIPVEIILAARAVPVDLNNVFINSSAPMDYIEKAELDGYPASACCWIKGIHGVIVHGGTVDTVIAVIEGDCSTTLGLVETLRDTGGFRVIPFAFPYDGDRNVLKLEIEKLAAALGTTMSAAENVLRDLERVRNKLRRLDVATWRDNTVTGSENFRWLVSSSDFDGDPVRFEARLDAFLEETGERSPLTNDGPRLGYIGVPPIFADFHDTVESRGARIVFNETPRQFSMPYDVSDLVDQYATYTYPYGVFRRIDDIRHAVAERKIDALIHYAQTFCYRQIEDPILRRNLDVPILTIEGDRPGPVDARTITRIEAFLESIDYRRLPV